MFAAAALQQLGRHHTQPARCAAQAVAPGRVVQRFDQRAVEFNEPRQRGLVQQLRQVALGAEAAPGAQVLLHRDVQLLARLQFAAQLAQAGQVGQPLLEEHRRQHAPVVGVVPQHLQRQHLGVAEQTVLVGVQRQRAVVESAQHLVEYLRVCGQGQAGSVACDELADVGVGDGNEVAARRIERVQKAPGLAGQRPAPRRQHLFAVE